MKALNQHISRVAALAPLVLRVAYHGFDKLEAGTNDVEMLVTMMDVPRTAAGTGSSPPTAGSSPSGGPGSLVRQQLPPER